MIKRQNFQLDEINQLFLPHMKTKLMWFYQDMEEPSPEPVVDPNKPGPSRQLQPSTSRGNLLQQHLTYKKKLFLTDGISVPLTGTLIYIFRTNSGKQLPEEGFQKVDLILRKIVSRSRTKLIFRIFSVV